jgi:hypothetical protein
MARCSVGAILASGAHPAFDWIANFQRFCL